MNVNCKCGFSLFVSRPNRNQGLRVAAELAQYHSLAKDAETMLKETGCGNPLLMCDKSLAKEREAPRLPLKVFVKRTQR